LANTFHCCQNISMLSKWADKFCKNSATSQIQCKIDLSTKIKFTFNYKYIQESANKFLL
jgi:hypothetical protein